MVDLTDFDKIFVLDGRDDEYRRLLEIQKNMLSGKPSIAFVAGDAGTGKTSLNKEFSRHSEEADSQLLVVYGVSVQA